VKGELVYNNYLHCISVMHTDRTQDIIVAIPAIRKLHAWSEHRYSTHVEEVAFSADRLNAEIFPGRRSHLCMQ